MVNTNISPNEVLSIKQIINKIVKPVFLLLIVWLLKQVLKSRNRGSPVYKVFKRLQSRLLVIKILKNKSAFEEVCTNGTSIS